MLYFFLNSNKLKEKTKSINIFTKSALKYCFRVFGELPQKHTNFCDYFTKALITTSWKCQPYPCIRVKSVPQDYEADCTYLLWLYNHFNTKLGKCNLLKGNNFHYSLWIEKIKSIKNTENIFKHFKNVLYCPKNATNYEKHNFNWWVKFKFWKGHWLCTLISHVLCTAPRHQVILQSTFNF